MTLDFHTNKKILEEVAVIPSKRLHNKIVRFSTHLMKRIQKGPVRGISLKLQEEGRERRMDFVPDESAIKVDMIEVDKKTTDLLASLGMSELLGIVLKEDVPVVSGGIPGGYGGGGRGGFGGGARRRYRWKNMDSNSTFKFNLCFVLFYMFLVKCFYLIFVIVLRFGSSIS
ncbi:putative ribosomal protein S17e [Helianthus anomalus]